MSASGGDPFIGRVFKDAYRIESKLGEGGFGAVYAAIQLAVERPVAIKVLRPDRLAHDEELRGLLTRRFQREAVATSRLMHPNTVRLIDFGQSADGVLFLVLELLHGADLSEIIRRDAPIELARVARIGQQVCQSLSEAHGLGIIHRDLKPSNIFVQDFDGVRDFVKVMDFGIARVVAADSAQSQLTRTGTVQGTPRYMAPEQAMALETGPPSDLYALGCILYEMLTGGPVFDAETLLAISLAHVQTPPPHLDLPGIPAPLVEAWDAVIQLLLRKNPADRPQSGGEVVGLLRDLEAASSIAHIVRQPPTPGTAADADWPSTPAIAAPSLSLQQDEPTAHAVGLQTFGDGSPASAIRLPKSSKTPWLVAAAAVPVAALLAWLLLSPGSAPTPLAPSNAVASRPSHGPRHRPVRGPGPGHGPGHSLRGRLRLRLRLRGRLRVRLRVRLRLRLRLRLRVLRLRLRLRLRGRARGRRRRRRPPPPATLSVTSRPSGAAVHRGDSPDAPVICTTPCDDLQLPAGTAPESLVLRLPGHLDTVVVARLDPGTTFRAATVLDPAPATPSARPRDPKRPATTAPAAASPPSTTATPPGSDATAIAPATSPSHTAAPSTEPAGPAEPAKPKTTTPPRPKTLPTLREAAPAKPARALPGLRTDDSE
jgi:serine/threonine protein kinase